MPVSVLYTNSNELFSHEFFFKKRAPKAFEAGNSNKSVDFPPFEAKKTHSPLHSIGFFFKKRAPKAFEAGNSNKSVDFPPFEAKKTHSPLHSIGFFFKAKRRDGSFCLAINYFHLDIWNMLISVTSGQSHIIHCGTVVQFRIGSCPSCCGTSRQLQTTKSNSLWKLLNFEWKYRWTCGCFVDDVWGAQGGDKADEFQVGGRLRRTDHNRKRWILHLFCWPFSAIIRQHTVPWKRWAYLWRAKV